MNGSEQKDGGVLRQGSMAQAPLPQARTAIRYSVKRGDTLSQIAKKQGISLTQLLTENPSYQANPDRLRMGDELLILSE